MLLKIMSAENAPDDDSRKTFTMLDHVAAVDFRRRTDRAGDAFVTFTDGSNETYLVGGNAYLISFEGSIITAFGAAPLPEKKRKAKR